MVYTGSSVKMQQTFPIQTQTSLAYLICGQLLIILSTLWNDSALSLPCGQWEYFAQSGFMRQREEETVL